VDSGPPGEASANIPAVRGWAKGAIPCSRPPHSWHLAASSDKVPSKQARTRVENAYPLRMLAEDLDRPPPAGEPAAGSGVVGALRLRLRGGAVQLAPAVAAFEGFLGDPSWGSTDSRQRPGPCLQASRRQHRGNAQPLIKVRPSLAAQSFQSQTVEACCCGCGGQRFPRDASAPKLP